MRARAIRAKFVAPIASPLIEDGVVVIRGGRIADVGRFDARAFARDDVDDLGDVVLMPGLVNAHTHLELSHAVRDPTPPASFGAWALNMVRGMATPPADDAIAAATRDGAAECLRFGVTTVGDITRSPGVTRAALRGGRLERRAFQRSMGVPPMPGRSKARAGRPCYDEKRTALNVVSFGEVRAMGRRRGNLHPMLDAAMDPASASDRLTIGVSPHAPYSVEPDGYRACLRVSEELEGPLTTHLAESPEEVTFLTDRAGPLRELWEAIGAWDDAVPRFAGSPVAFARSVGLLNARALLAHVNYASDADLDLLAAGNASVVWCPRTHAYFGHAPHRWREMLARGINVCVGTDSRATSPDLNVVDDLRLIRRQAPDVDPATLWAMVTTRAAMALGRGSTVGCFCLADLVAFPVSTGDPLAEVLDNPIAPAGVWAAGERVGTGRT